jgi:DNA (cytosine-5)-methyltransferase 1
LSEMLTAGSLFSGIGGLDLAFALAGFDILFQVEINEFCQKVLAKHKQEYWPHAEILADVRDVGKHNLPHVDVLFGGFPCQDLSTAGKRAGLVEGKRSGLWFEFARIIGEIRPRIVLLENVSGITKLRKGKDGEISPPDMALVIASLAQMGYDARWGIISAADAGAPHQRDRWFCVAYDNRECYTGNSRAMGEASKYPQEQKIRGESLGKNSNGRKAKRPIRGYRAEQRARKTRQMGNPSKPGLHGQGMEGWKTVLSEGSAKSTRRQGFKAGHGAQSRMGRNAYGLSPRLDGNRLMAHGWPAKPNQPQFDYEPPRLAGQTPNRAKRIEALGNGVVPQAVYPIAWSLYNLLQNPQGNV